MHYKAHGIPRRLFLGTGVGALASKLSQPAEADTAFTDFRFRATGAPTARTQPDRLNEIINVKDWGARGTSLVDDSDAIQNAIDYCIERGGGKIFFPIGQYKLSRHTLTVGSSNPNARVELIGPGMLGCSIFTTNTGFVISQGAAQYDNLARVEGLTITNGSQAVGSGAIKITGTNVIIRNVRTGGMLGIDASQVNGASILDSQGGSSESSGPANSTKPYPIDSIGFLLGNGCTAINCRLNGGFWIAWALGGAGASCIGCSAEVNQIAVRFGWGWRSDLNTYGEVPAVGCMLQNLQVERCTFGVDLYNAQGCLVHGNKIGTGGVGLPDPQNISSITWLGGTATVTVATPHNLAPGSQWLLLQPTGGIGPWRPGFFTYCTNTGPTTFTYSLSDPGGAYPGGGNWTYGLQYAVRCRIVTETAIIANDLTLSSFVGSVDLDYGRAAQHRNNVFQGSVGIWGWTMPSVSGNLGGWYFVNVGQNPASLGPNPVNRIAGPQGQMRYADLPGVFTPPGGQIYYQDPIEGQEYDIIDGQKYTGGHAVAAWGDQVIGGNTLAPPAGHYKVRYNGSQWTRIG